MYIHIIDLKYTWYMSNAYKNYTVIQKAYAILVRKFHGLEVKRFIIVQIAYVVDKCEQISSDMKIKYPKYYTIIYKSRSRTFTNYMTTR